MFGLRRPTVNYAHIGVIEKSSLIADEISTKVHPLATLSDKAQHMAREPISATSIAPMHTIVYS